MTRRPQPRAPRPPAGPWLVLSLAAMLVGSVAVAAADPLPRDTPAAHGVDGHALDAALASALDLPYLYGMVVVRDGVVIGERYRGDTSGTLRHVRSVTKSVTSLLVGIAIDNGDLPGTSARMVDYLPPGLQPSDPRADRITIGDLLTMRSGLRFDEDSEWDAWLASSNQAAFVLSRSLEAEPGTRFEYSTAAVHILSLVLEEATGLTELELADRDLFGPLGITERRWDTDRQGYYFAGHGLQLRLEDMAKLGLLASRRGRWGTEQVVAPEWLATSTAVQVDFNQGAFGPLEDIDYGYLWWLDHSTPSPVAIAWGWGGQFVVVMPGQDLVVTSASRWQVSLAQANLQEAAVLTVIVDEVLPAVGPRQVDYRRAGGRVGDQPEGPGSVPQPFPGLGGDSTIAAASGAGAGPAMAVSSSRRAAAPPPAR